MFKGDFMAGRPRVWIRRGLLLGIGIVCIFGALGYVRYFLERPMGQGPAGPKVPKDPFSQTWTERAIHVVGIGDSITAGLGAKSSDHTFFHRILQNPSDEYADMEGKCLGRVLPHLESENLAISGSTSLTHLEVIENKLHKRPDEVYGIVLMTSGGNDLIHSYGRSPAREGAMYGATWDEAQPWIENYRERLKTMFGKIQAAFPGGCEIYIADIYDPTDGVGDAPSVYLPHWSDGLRIHREYNRVLAQCAQEAEGVYLVPLHANFLGHGSHCRQFWRTTYHSDDPYYWFYVNIEDPNDRGYDAIRRIFLNEILKHHQWSPVRIQR